MNRCSLLATMLILSGVKAFIAWLPFSWTSKSFFLSVLCVSFYGYFLVFLKKTSLIVLCRDHGPNYNFSILLAQFGQVLAQLLLF